MIRKLSKLIAGACIIGSSLFYSPNTNADNLQNLKPVPQAQVQELETITTADFDKPNDTDKALFWSFNVLNGIDAYQTKVRFDRAGIEEKKPLYERPKRHFFVLACQAWCRVLCFKFGFKNS